METFETRAGKFFRHLFSGVEKQTGVAREGKGREEGRGCDVLAFALFAPFFWLFTPQSKNAEKYSHNELAE